MKILTGNRLLDGRVAYFDGSGWTASFADASILRTPEQLARAEAAKAEAISENFLAGAYFLELVDEPIGPRPRRTREVIRSLGPTVREDLQKTKQSAGSAQNGAYDVSLR